MSPASKEEYATIKQCVTRIGHLEDRIKELRQELINREKEKTERERFISDRRLAIYLAIASILGGCAVKIFDWLVKLVV